MCRVTGSQNPRLLTRLHLQVATLCLCGFPLVHDFHLTLLSVWPLATRRSPFDQLLSIGRDERTFGNNGFRRGGDGN